ncbi:hypothetical protein [Mycoplasma hafezii]|uniref:hypothetical protein n=1 Tax=Mycoplasma hafezii TaxID=525886 RepID=UPI003CEC38AC
MKLKNKWLLKFIPIGTVTLTLPLVMTSCSNEADKKQIADLQAQVDALKKQNSSASQNVVLAVRDNYKQASNEYDEKIKELAAELKTIKAEKDKELKAQKMSILKTRVQNELKPLVVKTNTLLSLLRNVEKETNSKLRTIKIFHSNDEHGRIEFDDGKYNLYSGMLKTGDYLKDKDYDLLLSAGDMIQGLPLSDTDKGKTIANIAKNIGPEFPSWKLNFLF